MTMSARLELLRKQIDTLRTHLLPAQFDPTGAYAPEQITQAVAYRVLCHAEIESYIEDRARDTAVRALSGWDKAGLSRRVLLALIAFSGREMEAPPATIAPPQPSQTKVWPEKLELSERIRSSGSGFVSFLKKNHGVKEENLLSMLLPVGVDARKLDPLWVSEMSSFGELRGDVAHNSLAGKVVQLPDPKAEYERVERLILGLEKLDMIFDDLNQ